MIDDDTTDQDASGPALDRDVTRICMALAERMSARCVVRVTIERWFGDRWLGFKGKSLGALGVRSRIGIAERLAPPPFHPSRVGDVVLFERSGADWAQGEAPAIHGLRSSEQNMRRRLVDELGAESMVCWWSRDASDEGARVALMAYWIGEDADDGVWAELAWDGSRVRVARAVEPPGGAVGSLLEAAC